MNAGEVPVNRLVGVKEENFKSKIYSNISLLLSQRIMHTVVQCNYYTLIQQSIVHYNILAYYVLYVTGFVSELVKRVLYTQLILRSIWYLA